MGQIEWGNYSCHIGDDVINYCCGISDKVYLTKNSRILDHECVDRLMEQNRKYTQLHVEMQYMGNVKSQIRKECVS